MKTKYWIGILAVLLAVCLGLSLWLMLPGEAADFVEVWSDGELLYTLSLHSPQQLEVVNGTGVNEITIRDGKVAVTHANCPDGYCMQRGFCSSGAQIVCLPNRLVLKFVGGQQVDTVVG